MSPLRRRGITGLHGIRWPWNGISIRDTVTAPGKSSPKRGEDTGFIFLTESMLSTHNHSKQPFRQELKTTAEEQAPSPRLRRIPFSNQKPEQEADPHASSTHRRTEKRTLGRSSSKYPNVDAMRANTETQRRANRRHLCSLSSFSGGKGRVIPHIMVHSFTRADSSSSRRQPIPRIRLKTRLRPSPPGA